MIAGKPPDTDDGAGRTALVRPALFLMAMSAARGWEKCARRSP